MIQNRPIIKPGERGSMLVYRVETRFSVIEAGKNFGPYGFDPEQDLLCALGWRWSISYLPYAGDSHAEPWDDGIPEFDYQMYCGFIDLQQLYLWFDGSVDYLRNGGFFITVYEVTEENVFLGNNQLAFIMDKASLIDCIYF